MERRDFLAWTGSLCSVLAVQTGAQASSNRRKIRVGQIGTTHGHASKISVYRESEDYEVVGIVEPNLELREKAKRQAHFHDLQWMSQDQLLNMTNLDAVLVETTPDQSLAVAQACISAGKHIHLDKPAGMDWLHFQSIMKSAKERQLFVQLGYMFRYNPAFQLLRHTLEAGWLGEIFEVHAVMSKTLGAADRQSLEKYPGGMMFELGCHMTDLVVALLGKPAHVTSFCQHASKQDDQLADNTLAVLEYPGALASVKSSAQEVEGFSRRHFVVCGTAGSFQIQPLDNPSVKVAFAKPHDGYSAQYQEVSVPKFTRYVADAAEMAAIVRGEKSSTYGYEHDLCVQQTVLRTCGVQTG